MGTLPNRSYSLKLESPRLKRVLRDWKVLRVKFSTRAKLNTKNNIVLAE